MTKIMIVLMTFAIALSAQASMLVINGPLDAQLHDSEVNENKTYFETLGDLYNAGTRPAIDKIINVAWSGRCFVNNDQSTPINGGYIFRKMKNPDVGPIGRDVVKYEAATYWKQSEAPNYYDNMSMSQVLKGQPNISFSPVSIKTNELEMYTSSKNYSSVKVSGKYLVEELYIIDPTTDSGPLGRPAKKTVEIRCYYFIPEMN